MPNDEQNFFADSKTELGAFLPPSAIGGLINRKPKIRKTKVKTAATVAY